MGALIEMMIHTDLTGRKSKRWDVFLSHAFEDKETVARPLAHYLDRHGLRVWFDEFQLTVGDSLSETINAGLADSLYGVVIISPSFMTKRWTRNELNGLFALERPSRGLLLPVWHQVTTEEVARFNPILADRVAINTSRGVEGVGQALLSKFGHLFVAGEGLLSGYWFGASGRLWLEQEENLVRGNYDWYGKPWVGSLQGEYDTSSRTLKFAWSWLLGNRKGEGDFRYNYALDRGGFVHELRGGWWSSSEVNVHSWMFARDIWQERLLSPEF